MKTVFSERLKVHPGALGRLESINRYPIKGFSGQQLSKVNLSVDNGLPGDRRWAIRNGSLNVESDGRWTQCQAFVRMTREDGLPLYQIHDNENGELLLQHPSGEKILVQESEKGKPLLSKWFGHTESGFSKAHAHGGYWDHSDATISIINLTTVRALSRASGQELDPQRFRGNLLIETDEPWVEFSFVGRRLLIGDVEIEILRPIDRCKATAINPNTGETDINLPHLLASLYGHIYCGVYARVVKAGLVVQGASLYDIGTAPLAVVRAAEAITAPRPEEWPRAMRVLKRVVESENVVSFWLEDPLANLIPEIAPSSYLRLHVQGSDGPLSRSYTISNKSPDGVQLRLSIKKEKPPAQLSPWVHTSLNEGDTIVASGPFIDPSLEWRPNANLGTPILILTAGIGITVATSVLVGLLEAGVPGSVRIGHGVRGKKDLALWQEIFDTAQAFTDAKTYLFMSRVNLNRCKEAGARQGRIDLDEVVEGIDLEEAQIFLCGPSGFGGALRTALIKKGARDYQIHEDAFCSPQKSIPQNNSPSCLGPLTVRFVKDDFDATWTQESGTLLDLADANGINVPANCRSGACRACLMPINGSVENLIEPVSPPPKGWAYLCCVAPLAPVTIFPRKSGASQ